MMKQIKRIDRNYLLTILITILFFSLGASLVKYLGKEVHLVDFISGLLWSIFIQFSANGLNNINNNKTDFSGDDIKQRHRSEITFRFLILILFFGGLVFLTIFVAGKTPNIYLWTLILISYILLFLIPSLLNRDNLAMALSTLFFQSSLIPAIAYNIFSSGFHHSLVAMVFPLTMILLAVSISREFSTYANDEILDKKTIIRSIGWRKGIVLHHFLLILSLALLIMKIGNGLPSKLFVPILLACPLIIFDIFWLQRIKSGFKPIWPFFNALSYSMICVIVYLFAYTLWIN
jgi:1,4-dihydroxy-2-naphthoate octaprenyltransferase